MTKPSRRTAVQKAQGYVNAAMVSLGIARRILPEQHPQVGRIDNLAEELERLHDDLGGA